MKLDVLIPSLLLTAPVHKLLPSPVVPVLEKLLARADRQFEVAPTGQWVDLRINRVDVTHDWQWKSGMKTAAQIDETHWRVAMAIPFAAFGITPQVGDAWDANLFRVSCVNGERQFLAYSPTFTDAPSFHVPERFVKLSFERKA